ncbi:MAG: hypothetical protein M1840_007880, partial [Geoglossum simile]
MRHKVTTCIASDLNTTSDHETLLTQIGIKPGHRNTAAGHSHFQMDTTDRELFKSTLESAIIPAEHTAAELSQNQNNTPILTLLDRLAEEISQAILTALTASTKKASGG